MDPLSITASIIAILQLSAKVLAYLNNVKDASKDRARCEIEASALHSLLVSLRCRLEGGSADQPWYTAVRALAVQNGPLDQFKQALEALQAHMTNGGRLRKAGQALMWKFKQEEILSILARMERLKGLVGIALEMDHFKLSQAIKDDTTVLRTQVPFLQTGVDTIRQQHDSAKHRLLLDWISASDYPAQQSDIIKRREQGTGQWFLDAPEVSQWLHEPKTTLFCPGIPGAGKTMIAAIAIDHLLNSIQHSTHGVAYVYCNYKAQEEQDASSLLAAILKQLVSGQPSAVEDVERLHQKHAHRDSKPSLNEITDALRDVLAQYPYVYVIIDALDECQNAARQQMLAKLRDLQAGNDIRLLVTARFIPDIEDAFRAAIKLEVQASKEDVERFITGQTYLLPTCIQRSAVLQDMVLEQIVDAVDGMFLLARLYVDSLRDKRTPKDVKTTLAKLTKGADALGAAYTEALRRIEGQLEGDRELAKRVLSWVTFAKRPLTIAEICCALAVEPDDTEIDPDGVPDGDDIVAVCAGLVVVDQQSAIIRLVHFTTQQYFEQTGEKWIPDGQLRIAETCLTYLCFDAFQGGTCSTEEECEKRLKDHPFFDYAARHWAEHARQVEDDVADQVCTFLGSTSFSSVAQVLRFRVIGYREKLNKPSVTTPLHGPAYYGLAKAAGKILCVPGPVTDMVNAKNDLGDTPLSIAAKQGHSEMIKLLLDNKADVNAQGGRFTSALFAASMEGHEQVVQLLLDKKADVNAGGGYYGNALQSASARGHEQVVKLLLGEKADVNAEGGHYGNALTAAAAEGHEQVVKLLLKKKANINAEGEYFGNALIAAAARGHEQVLEILLDNNADINAHRGHYGNALHAAAHEGQAKTLCRLIVRSDISQLHDSYGRTLLWWAAAGGDVVTVEMLIVKHKFDPCTADIFGRKPSWIAAKKGNSEASKLLQAFDGQPDPDLPAPPSEDPARSARICDVCTSIVYDSVLYYNCKLCDGGAWDICEECRNYGATCMKTDHILIKRKMLDGVYSEITD